MVDYSARTMLGARHQPALLSQRFPRLGYRSAWAPRRSLRPDTSECRMAMKCSCEPVTHGRGPEFRACSDHGSAPSVMSSAKPRTSTTQPSRVSRSMSSTSKATQLSDALASLTPG